MRLPDTYEMGPVIFRAPAIAPSSTLPPSTLDPTSYMLPKKTRRRRKVHELERKYECAQEGCERRYASESALHQHLWLKHQIKRCRNGSSDSVSPDATASCRPAPYALPNNSRRPGGSANLANLNDGGVSFQSAAYSQRTADCIDLLRLVGSLGGDVHGAHAAAGLEGPMFRTSTWHPQGPRTASPLTAPSTPNNPVRPSIDDGLGACLGPILSPQQTLTEQTDQELKAELRRLLDMFQTVEAMEMFAARKTMPIGV